MSPRYFTSHQICFKSLFFLLGQPYSNVVDWWALATMTYEMINGLPPFWDEAQHDMLEKICACNIDAVEFDPAIFTPECTDFIKSV